MFKFLHAADVHLDSPLRGLESHEGAPVDEIRGASRRAFSNFIDLAIEEKVHFVLLAGDLFDGDWKDYNTGLYFVKSMSRLRKAGILVFLVLGNHDAASRITKSLQLPDNVKLFSALEPETVLLEELGVAICGISHQGRKTLNNLAVSFPPPDPHYLNIAILHTSLNGRAGHDTYAPCSVDDLVSKGYDYWALGHVHQAEKVSEDPWIVFPGCLQGRHIRETGAKGALLVSVENGQVCEVEERRVDVLRWKSCRADLSQCETLEAVLDTVRVTLQTELDTADGRSLAIRLYLEGNCSVHDEVISGQDYLVEELRSLAVDLGDIWLEKISFRTERLLTIEELVGEESPLADLLKIVDQVEYDHDTLFDSMPELMKLKNKLPRDMKDALLPDSAESRDEFARDVREILLASLLSRSKGS